MRKGSGITGSGVAHVSPQLSGRLTLHMLHQMQEARKESIGFSSDKDEEFRRVKELLASHKQLDERRDGVTRGTGGYTEIQMRNQLKSIAREKQELEAEVFMELKRNFKHITGMWPKTAKFETEAQRLDSWQTTAVIKQKIYGPSRRLIICEEGVQRLSAEKAKYDEFLKHFRSKGAPKSPRSNVDESVAVRPRGSLVGGSSVGNNSRLGRNSVASLDRN